MIKSHPDPDKKPPNNSTCDMWKTKNDFFYPFDLLAI